MIKEQNIPWYQVPKIDWRSDRYKAEGIEPPQYDFIVVGAGIAGASMAYELANAGFRPLLLEAEAEVATAGSGNHQGMLYLKLSPHTQEQNELLISGLYYVRYLLQKLTGESLLKKGEDWDDCGLIQLAISDKEQRKQQQLATLYPQSLLQQVDRARASELSGVSVTSGGLYFPTSGWVSPRALVRALLASTSIELACSKRVIDIKDCSKNQNHFKKCSKEHPPLWEVRCDDGSLFRSKGVILAMAEGVSELSQCRHIPFTVVRGQTTTIAQDNPLKMVISGEGYIAPAKGNIIRESTFGATFRRYQTGGYLTLEEHRENIAMLEKSSPELVGLLGVSSQMNDDSLKKVKFTGRAATRASAMGSMPIVGPIANREYFMAHFSAIRADAKAIPTADVPWEKGLYLTTAHGSRGMISAPISAALLSHYILGEGFEMDRLDLDLSTELNLSQSLRNTLHPNRFYYHALRFNQPL